MRTILAVAAVLAGLFGPTPAAFAAPAPLVDVAIVLAADVSRSIDDGEFELQRKGYAAAMMDPRVLRAIAGGHHHAIAVTFFEWSGADEQNVVVDWTVVRDEETAATIAATMLRAPRSFQGRTSISAAIEAAMRRLAAAPVRAGKRIIDISGDGTSNAGDPIGEARDAAVASGVTINGLAINNTSTSPGYSFHTHPPGGLPKYYRDNVIGGPGAFLLKVADFHSFADAMARKLVAEIAAAGKERLAGR
jgi:Protein of unknown function (DUF1194)